MLGQTQRPKAIYAQKTALKSITTYRDFDTTNKTIYHEQFTSFNENRPKRQEKRKRKKESKDRLIKRK